MSVDPNKFAEHVNSIAKKLHNKTLTPEQLVELFPTMFRGFSSCPYCGKFTRHFSCYEAFGEFCHEPEWVDLATSQEIYTPAGFTVSMDDTIIGRERIVRFQTPYGNDYLITISEPDRIPYSARVVAQHNPQTDETRLQYHFPDGSIHDISRNSVMVSESALPAYHYSNPIRRGRVPESFVMQRYITWR